jgi:hypothetical protein
LEQLMLPFADAEVSDGIEVESPNHGPGDGDQPSSDGNSA